MSSTLIEAFLLIEQPRQRLGHWTAALASLDSPLAPAPAVVVAYYDPSSDQALLNLQYDAEQLGESKLDFVVQVALLAEVGMVQPAELFEGERVRFLAARLTRCTIRVTGQRSSIGALTELARRIKAERSPQAALQPPPIPPQRPKVPMPARAAMTRPPMVADTRATASEGHAAKTLAGVRAVTPAGGVPETSSRTPAAGVPVLQSQRGSRSGPMPIPRGPVEEPPLTTAKGTRDDLTRLTTDDPDLIPDIDFDDDVVSLSKRLPTFDLSRREQPAALPPPSTDASPTYVAAIEHLTDPPQTSRNVFVRRSRSSTVEMPPEVAAHAASECEDDRITSPMNLEKLNELVAREDSRNPRPQLRPPTENDFAEEDDVRPATMPALRAGAKPIAPLPPAESAAVRTRSEPAVSATRRSDPGATGAKRRAAPELGATSVATTQPNVIYARYLRGGRWVPVRVGALSIKGAALLAGALPRSGDRVDIALSFGSCRALVRGIVAKVSSVREAATTGASTFSVEFTLDEVSKRQLTTLLVAARDAKITIKPPPPRANRRFPVEWHIALATPKGAVKTVALDVSTAGMFVRSPVSLQHEMVANFSVVCDDGGSPIGGRVRVVRKITEAEARACGLAAGFGLEIIDMSEADRMRWLGFLARIERRAEKRVLIGAEPARLAELQAGLASLGYAVSGGTDPGTLVQLASGDARLADAVLIDAGWLANESSTSLVESLFSARNVPCVTMQGEVRRARQAIDRLLEVVV